MEEEIVEIEKVEEIEVKREIDEIEEKEDKEDKKKRCNQQQINGNDFERKTDNLERLLEKGFTMKYIQNKYKKDKCYHYLVKRIEKRIENRVENPISSMASSESSSETMETMVYFTQECFVAYFGHFFQKKMFRKPDEAYLFVDDDNSKYRLKILEKKSQKVPGSNIEKLETGVYKKQEMQSCLGPDFQVSYAYCLCNYLKDQYLKNTEKFIFLRNYNKEHDIHVLFGEEEDYFSKLDAWIHS